MDFGPETAEPETQEEKTHVSPMKFRAIPGNLEGGSTVPRYSHGKRQVRPNLREGRFCLTAIYNRYRIGLT